MHASTEGLQQHQVSTLTKHQTDKLSQAYWCEMERPTMTVMAGFSMGEAYFVPREKVELPLSNIRECIDKILGRDYSKWEAQQQADKGDKSECGEMFFSRLIPFLIEVLVQDGIYFVHDFPIHQMSNLLQVSHLAFETDIFQHQAYLWFQLYQDKNPGVHTMGCRKKAMGPIGTTES